jgi:hypothetical protein
VAEARELKASGFEVPNLDGLSIDPQELREAAGVFTNLAEYARNKASAMENRLNGNIERALYYESLCDGIYRRLPRWARW